MSRRNRLGLQCCLGIVVAVPLPAWTSDAAGATTQKRYYAHEAVEDRYGVIAPWYWGQNGQIDRRVRTAAEFLKRYPWVGTDKSVMAGPHYVFNARVDLDAKGAIQVLPATDAMNGNLGQRFKYITESLPRYYRYSGDPVAIGHVKIAADFYLDCCLTPADHPWPRFPISVPVKGKPYGRAEPGGYLQLDLAAGIGLGMLRAHQLTGERRYLEAARHWGDLFAEKCDHRPKARPWGRYANPKDVPWGVSPTGNIQTGGVVNVLIFLDELIRLGYTGREGAIEKARDAGRAYLGDTLLPAWHVWDTWGRHYWDWEHPVHGIVTTGWVSQYLMDHPESFPNWKHDVRNVLTLFFHHACVSPQSNGDVYSGAWAFPEGSSCCGRSLDICPVFLSRYLARYAAQAQDPWAREVARRAMILGTYHFHESGMVEDNIDGGQITAREWSELIGPGPILCGLEFMEWLPEISAPSRENHLVRSAGTVTSIEYGKGRIAYTTFDAPAPAVDVLRLAFRPTRIAADGQPLQAGAIGCLSASDPGGTGCLSASVGPARVDNPRAAPLDSDNGYTAKPLPDGDWIVTIRHDGKRSILVEGEDPQEVADDGRLEFQGAWQVVSDARDSGGTVRRSDRAGSAAVHRFEGNQVRVIGRADPSGGLADVFLDGVKQPAGIDAWVPTATRFRQVLFAQNGLAGGPHELKIIVRGERNPCSAGSSVWIDATQSSRAVGEFDFGCAGGPTGPQRMIFGYTGRKPYVDSAGNPWLPATELVIRSGHHTDPVALCWRTQPAAGPIANTPDPELYRYGVQAAEFWANLTVGPGSYRVGLRLAETRSPADPARKPMTIRINGRDVVTAMDLAAKAGGFRKALDLTFDGIQPKNGVIEVRFLGTEGGKAMAQAMEVLPDRG